MNNKIIIRMVCFSSSKKYLQQICTHWHFTACNLCTILFADPAKWQISHLKCTPISNTHLLTKWSPSNSQWGPSNSSTYSGQWGKIAFPSKINLRKIISWYNFCLETTYCFLFRYSRLHSIFIRDRAHSVTSLFLIISTTTNHIVMVSWFRWCGLCWL